MGGTAGPLVRFFKQSGCVAIHEYFGIFISWHVCRRVAHIKPFADSALARAHGTDPYACFAQPGLEREYPQHRWVLKRVPGCGHRRMSLRIPNLLTPMPGHPGEGIGCPILVRYRNARPWFGRHKGLSCVCSTVLIGGLDS